MTVIGNSSAGLSLVQSWLAVATADGRPITAALDDLNARLGTDYGLSRMGTWRNGRRPLPRPVADYMLRVCIGAAIRAEGGVPPRDDAALSRLIARLTPPARRAREVVIV